MRNNNNNKSKKVILARASRKNYHSNLARCERDGAARKNSYAKKKPPKKPKYKQVLKVIAPNLICIYKKQNHIKTMHFIEDLEEKTRASKGAVVCICFRNSGAITAGACALLLATVDKLKSQYPETKYKVIYPPTVPYIQNGNNGISVVSSVLSQVGFFKLIGVASPKYKKLNHVDCWQVTSGESVESAVLGEMLQSLPKEVVSKGELYRPALEAMCNSVEHGYDDKFCNDTKKTYKKWWSLSAVVDGHLVVIVCDLGVGIPYTLPRTQSSSMITRLGNRLERTFTKDSDYIQASLFVKKTRTAKEFRGKGGQDLRAIVECTPNSTLQVLSNRGTYTFKTSSDTAKTQERCFDNDVSIKGTVTGWSIKLNDGTTK